MLTWKKRDLTNSPRALSELIHGDSGTGKTHIIGTAIQAGLKTAIVVCQEEELVTLDRMGIKGGYDYFTLTDFGKVWELYLDLRKNEQKWDLVAIDGFLDFQGEAKDRAVSEGQAIPYDKLMTGQVRLYRQHWGQILEMLRHFLNPLVQLPYHKIVTCLSEVAEDPKDGSLRIYPAVQGALQKTLGAYFSVVGYSFIQILNGKALYCLTTAPHPAITTKDRLGFNRVFVDPNFKAFVDLYYEGKEVPKRSEEENLERLLMLVRPPVKKEEN